jgi:hypothetical protein
MTIAAAIATTLLSVVVIFQIALAAGAPLGKAAWGGRHEGVLPKGLRIASGVVAFAIYPLVIVAVLDAAGPFGRELLPGSDAGVMWTLAALFTVGALANLASRSTLERFWAPVSLAIAASCAFLASAL